MSAGVPLFLLGLAVLSGGDGGAAAESGNPRVVLETSQGTIVVELYIEQAPESVASFLRYVDEGFYDGVIFHRVIDGFMVQGGGFDAEMGKKPTHGGIQNEADNGLKNTRGTLAMARTMDPHSASSQFFVNLVDNDFLDHTSKTPQGWGYAVFGAVAEGMEVVDAISKVPTGRRGPMGDVPVEPVTILSAKRQEAQEAGGGAG